MQIVNFTPVSALIGGAIIGLSAAMLWWLTGRIAGVSTILGQTFNTEEGELNWRLAFLGGLITAGLGTELVAPEVIRFDLSAGYGQLIVAGLLVGVGTQVGSGCTSGHGVCGVSRLSVRSIVATLCFMATGMLAVFALRQGGWL